VSRFTLLESVFFLQQPGDLPRTCPEHAYPTCPAPSKDREPDSDDHKLRWTRLSCHKFVANQVRLWLFVLTYNLGNFMRRLVLPEDMKHWTLTSLQTRLIKTGGRLVRHARRLVFQLAEVLGTREMLTGILERISRLRLAPG
jgi:hypothetical protein